VKWIFLLEGLEGCSKTMDAEADGGGIDGRVSHNQIEDATSDHLRIQIRPKASPIQMRRWERGPDSN
jgi:hypothetical protein